VAGEVLALRPGAGGEAIHWLGEQFNTAWDGIRAVAEIVWDGLLRAWYSLCECMVKAWHDASSLIRMAANSTAGAVEKAWNWISEGGPWANQAVLQRKNREVDQGTDQSNAAIAAEWDAKIKATEAEYAQKRAAQQQAHQAAMAAIGQESKARSDATKAAADLAVKEAEDAVAKARKEWEDARKEAAGKRQEKEARGEMPNLGPQEDLLAKAKAQLNLGLGDLAMAHSQAAGTFPAAGAFGFGGAGATMTGSGRFGQAERTAARSGAAGAGRVQSFSHFVS
jgi:hypothetical protein